MLQSYARCIGLTFTSIKEEVKSQSPAAMASANLRVCDQCWLGP
jgi:hypothetical protein